MKALLILLFFAFICIPHKSNSQKNANLDFERIGVTIYDLQTNASIQRRILLHDDGRLSAVWTTSPDPSPWQQRGTGYNHFDGNNWLDPVSRNSRIEGNVRTGWPNIGVITTDNGDIEYVIAHNAQASGTSSGGMQFSKNTAIGDEIGWSTVEVLSSSPNSSNAGPIWARTAYSGSYIYLVANYFGDNNITINGIENPTVYSRYDIENDVWINNSELLPGYSSDYYSYGTGDTYSIDARDSIVVIAIGGRLNDIAIWKSFDYGNSFEKIVLDTFLHEAFDPTKQEHVFENWTETNDGSIHVILDEEGNAHVFWGTACMANPDPDQFTYYARGMVEDVFTTEMIHCFGLRYMNDINISGINNVYEFAPKQYIATILDRNGDNKLTLADEIAGFPRINTNDIAFYPHVSSSGVVSMPTAAIDDEGNIFVVYSAILEHALTIDYEHYRDVYVVYSTNNGQNWSNPQNITDDINNEQIFPSVAKDADDFIHLTFVEMSFPGTSVQNGKDQNLRDIIYVNVPVEMILKDELGPGELIYANPPSLMFPYNNSNEVLLNPQFAWQQTDGFVQHYHLMLSEDQSFTQIVIDTQYITNTNFTSPELLSQNTTYYWKVSSGNLNGFGEFSDVWSFTTTGIPEVPFLYTPENKSYFIETTPQFTWQNAARADEFHFLLSENQDFTQILIDTQVLNPGLTCPITLSYNTEYFWKVRAENNYGYSDFSNTWSFKTKGIPEPPQLYDPANNSVNIEVTPTLYWNESIGADEYHLLLSDNQDFTTNIIDTQVLNTNLITPLTLSHNTEYFWKVRAENNFGYSDFSDTWSFTTQTPSSVFENLKNQDQLKVYPNPAKDQLNFKFNLASTGHVSVYISDALGRKVISAQNKNPADNEHTIKVDVSKLKNGIYFYQIVTEKENWYGKVEIVNRAN